MAKRYSGKVRWLAHPDHPWRAYRSGEILAKFGLPPGRAIPPNYSGQLAIDGVRVAIFPKRKKGMEKRVFAFCPECHEMFEAGHLHQHTEARHP